MRWNLILTKWESFSRGLPCSQILHFYVGIESVTPINFFPLFFVVAVCGWLRRGGRRRIFVGSW